MMKSAFTSMLLVGAAMVAGVSASPALKRLEPAVAAKGDIVLHAQQSDFFSDGHGFICHYEDQTRVCVDPKRDVHYRVL